MVMSRDGVLVEVKDHQMVAQLVYLKVVWREVMKGILLVASMVVMMVVNLDY